MRATPEAPLEIWGGVECTINRVRDAFHDQLAASGHLERPSDIDAFAALGLRGLRIAVPWERAQRRAHDPVDIEYAAPLLERVERAGMKVACGLVHHGSGPAFTGLLQPSFEHGLAAYARRVAARFPWLELYTPVNEPLTTARFSGLYGHWYPHHRQTRSFVRMLIHQCRATVRAMAAIRAVRSDARLLQTEDIGTAFASPSLRYQADYENERRFLSFDLLCGKVDRRHALYEHLRREGAHERELAWFLEHPCPPDVVGINYYVTSDRYLDADLEAHPVERHGGNGRVAYADIEAVRRPGVGLVGHEAVLRSVWERYGLPLALAEVHLGCTREEQLRWLDEAHAAAQRVRRDGIDVRALTVWALLGAFDWNSLVVEQSGVYESGVYDVRSRVPRPTALASMVRALATRGTFEHPALAAPGWWRRVDGKPKARRARPAPLVVTGANGALGRAFADACSERGLEAILLDRHQLDIAGPSQVADVLRRHAPWAVINAAGTSRSLLNPSAVACGRNDVHGASVLAEACREHQTKLITFSCDLVFDGRSAAPYVEGHAVGPECVLGRAKVAAERRVLEILPEALVVRSGVLLATHRAQPTLERFLTAGAVTGIVSTSYAPHLAHASLDLLIDGAAGIWHLANAGAVDWRRLLDCVALAHGLQRREAEALPCGHPTSRRHVLESERGALMPSLDESLALWLRRLREAA